MLKSISFLLLLAATIASPVRTADSANSASPASNESQVWNLEKAYWEYVKANDLEKYRGLWHDDFVGWPLISPEPVQKDHITDWITNNTSKGLKLHAYSIEQRAIKVTGDIAIDHYRVKLNWAKGDAVEAARVDASRITHTWIRTNGTWKIIGGMSAPVNADGK